LQFIGLITNNYSYRVCETYTGDKLSVNQQPPCGRLHEKSTLTNMEKSKQLFFFLVN